MKNVKKILIGIVLLILLPVLVSATDYYVSTTGSDSNSGTSTSQAWRTIGRANSALQAGDTVYIMNGVYNERINPANSGSTGNYITYTSYPGHNPNIYGQTNPVYIGSDKHHIRISNLRFDGGNQQDSVTSLFMRIHGDYIIIEDCILIYGQYGVRGDWNRGIQFFAGSQYGIVRGCLIHHIGKPAPPEPDLGEGIYVAVGSGYHLIENNEVYAGGHNTIQVYGDHTVVRNNNLHDENWGKVAALWSTDDNEIRYSVWENNDIYESDLHQNQYPNAGMQLGQRQAIFRGNRVYRNWGNGLDVYGSGVQYAKDARIYHNTFYDNGKAQLVAGYGIDIIENNLNPDFTGIVMKNNILYNNYHDGIRYKAYANSNDHFEVSNWEDSDGNPRFVNPSNGDFNLQSNSPAIDAGAWLTTTRSAGSGNNIPVQDATYFFDGYGIVEGDLIQLQGQTITARITNVNYNTNTLTVDRNLNWNNNQGISLPYSGSAPDIGAHEYGGSTPPTQYCGDNSCNNGETCSSCPQDCSCTSQRICCNNQCITPECNQNSDCGTNTACTTHTCNNPGTCSASCSSQGVTSCINNDGCCPQSCNQENDNDCIISSGTNLALNSVVTTSNEDYNPATFMVDGTWDEGGRYWAGRGSPNWVRIDLGQNYRINRIKIGPFGRGTVYYYDDEWNIKYSESSSQNTWNDFTSVIKVSGAGDLTGPGISIVNGDPGFQTSDDSYKYYEFTFNQVNARYILFTVTTGDIDGDSNGDEIEIYSPASEDIRGDVNNDGDIDLYDLILLAAEFGKTSNFNYPKADTDNNNIIDIFDVVFVASRMT